MRDVSKSPEGLALMITEHLLEEAPSIKRKLEDSEIVENARKKLKNKWKCDLCEITTTSEQLLELHMKGKKHKTKEKSVTIYNKEALATQEDIPPSYKSSGNSTNNEKNLKLEESKFEENASKKRQSQWQCDLCQITANGDKNFELHMQGKNHKAKEKLLLSTNKNEARAPEKDTRISSLRATKEDTHLAVRCFSSLPSTDENKRKLEDSIVKEKKEWKCGLCQIIARNEKCLQVHIKGSAHKAAEKLLADITKGKAKEMEQKIKFSEAAVLTAENCENKEEKGLNGNSNSEPKFWCKMCSFGTDSAEMMANHWNGKHHMNLLNRNGGCVTVIKTIPDS